MSGRRHPCRRPDPCAFYSPGGTVCRRGDVHLCQEGTNVHVLIEPELPQGHAKIEHTFAEVLFNQRKKKRSVYILNIYSNPTHRHY
ncbi:hypothetical protein HPB48_000395 [Haemaphysalis longicornis]|uniref:Uncharacterized protein n=1 Tax=Haemaphysalis longicornis TaxID=44386 RepID=A0A9J6G7T1_HAELO|nr:hypothetical protein HPB48_000395 [Haemaphysalis longicornis]